MVILMYTKERQIKIKIQGTEYEDKRQNSNIGSFYKKRMRQCYCPQNSW